MKSQLQLFLLSALIAGFNLISAGRIMAQTLMTLHSFTDGSDGAAPYAGLILSGNTLYGTAVGGGSVFSGTVFKVNTDGTDFVNLADFEGGSEGHPNGSLVLSGNTLYGTASGFDSGDGGAVFKVNTDGTGFASLHDFTARFGDPYANSDGAVPIAGLILSGDTLYGMAQRGGISSYGTVFKVNTDGSHFTNLHSFTGSNDDGAQPWAGLILSGNTLYGATAGGGSDGNGMVFAVKTDGTGFTNLHSFNYRNDGAYPRAGLALSGNTLYGTAFGGGNSGYGTVFAIHTDGTGFTNLHSFAAPSGSYPDFINWDGVNPYASLVLSGNTLYGTASGGGSSGKGTVFEVNTDGTGFRTLYSFTPIAGPEPSTNSDGATPLGGLILSGNTLYGTTQEGGRSGRGTVFSLSFAPQLTIRYVNVNSANPVSPYTNWATAATTIQDTVDAAAAGDKILVTNGVYQTGGRLELGATTNRVAVSKPVTVESVNGASVTLIQGDQVMRCVYLTNGAALVGFTLTGGVGNEDGGGGVWCESASAVVANCVLTGNWSQYGGGARGGTLNNCTLTGNNAFNGGGAYASSLNSCTLTENGAGYGGGAYASVLNNCTLTGNSAFVVGGVFECTLYNSIVYYNTSLSFQTDNHSDSFLSYSCTTPLPTNGIANLTDAPLFLDPTGGNLRLQSNSPCINAGSNPFAPVGADLDGNPRIVGGTVDMGCYEFQSAQSNSSSIRYVNVNSTSPTSPYTNWTTAATTIQEAVDAAVAGDQILVTNGVYQTGQRTVSGETNRVAVTKPVTLQSVNGPAATIIHGDPETRCVYLTNGAALMGFTLIGGAAIDGGGVWCESPSAVVSNCTITANTARQGGGAYGGTLFNCTLTSNSASGGGAPIGGGAHDCILNNCTLTRNSAAWLGGGASESALNNCTLSGNSASDGGGAFDSTLNNCLLTGNSAASEGGGAVVCTLNNCTLTGNSANEGGGAYNSTLNNCIVYYNRAPNGENSYSSRLSYSCTTPLPYYGVGNISAEPQLVDLSHLSAGSPCRGAGGTTAATGLDIDGESWANPPSIGCDEFHPGIVTGLLSVSIQAAYTNVIAGLALNLTAAIEGHATGNGWDFGDGMVVSNRLYASHSWAAAGEYLTVFKAYNDTNPGGITATVTVHVVAQPVHYVAVGSANPVSPYSSWATAANTIQDAVDAASVAGALVLVTNGIYRTGERIVVEVGETPNRVAVTKALMVRSVNGAAVTVIQGYRDPHSTYGEDGVRCVYLANNAALAGFTLTNGAASYGGGVWCESASTIVSNCILAGNLAYLGGGATGGTLNNCRLSGNSSVYGGGASGGTLDNCTLTANTALDGGGASRCTLKNCQLSSNTSSFGGGAIGSTLINCTFSGNLATNSGGGASGCRLTNCIVYNNSASNGDNYSDESFLSYSCTTPLPTNGFANLTNAPLFLDQGDGDLRPQSNSPCINAGYNTSAPAGLDLDGNPRIAGGTVDMGAYEFQSPQSLISYAWLQQYGLCIDGSADYTDADGDGLNNWQEWRAGTDPTKALSALRLLSPTLGASGVVVSWQSEVGPNYFLERGVQLGAQPLFLPLATGIVGQPGTTMFTDTNTAGAGPFFYRVGVQE